jgi:hypothetical protein
MTRQIFDAIGVETTKGKAILELAQNAAGSNEFINIVFTGAVVDGDYFTIGSANQINPLTKVSSVVQGRKYWLKLLASTSLTVGDTTLNNAAAGAVTSVTINGHNMVPGDVFGLSTTGTAALTGAMGAAVTGSVGSSGWNAVAAAGVMTISGSGAGIFSVGDTISGTGVAAKTVITSLGSGTGGTGTYNVSVNGVAGSAAWTLTTDASVGSASNVLDATVVTGLITVGDKVTGSGFTTANIASLGTGTGGTGTYVLSGSQQTFASAALVDNSNLLNATAVTGAIAVGDAISGNGASMTAGTVTAILTGTGGVGHYTLSGAQQHVASGTMFDPVITELVRVRYVVDANHVNVWRGYSGSSVVAHASGTALTAPANYTGINLSEDVIIPLTALAIATAGPQIALALNKLDGFQPKSFGDDASGQRVFKNKYGLKAEYISATTRLFISRPASGNALGLTYSITNATGSAEFMNGVEVGEVQRTVIIRVPTAAEVTAGYMDFALPFAAATAKVTGVVTATGAPATIGSTISFSADFTRVTLTNNATNNFSAAQTIELAVTGNHPLY